MSVEPNTATDNLRTNPYEMEPELRPCPFCGKTDMLSLDNLTDETDYCIECERCHISQHAYFTHEGAIAAWNTRTDYATLEAQIAEQQKEIARLKAPVSDEEWLGNCEILEAGEVIGSKQRVIGRGGLNSLIAARAKEQP